MTDADRARYTRELTRLLDTIDELQEERSSTMKDYASSIAKAQTEARHWRALLAGRKGEQLPLPVEASGKKPKP